jgi:hypothetical protein
MKLCNSKLNRVSGSLLRTVVKTLRKRGIKVQLSRSEQERIDIAQLQNKNMIINTRARDTLSIIFTIAHLYGHLIQYSNYKKYAHLIEEVKKEKPLELDEKFKKQFYRYELEAFCIGKGLMLEAFNITREMDSKYAIFMKTDFSHFWAYITTGEKGDIETFNQMLKENYKHWKRQRHRLMPIMSPRSIVLTKQIIINVE